MGSVRRIPVIRHGEDVYAADETKVHTFSRQAIAVMLQTAECDEGSLSSAPPPPAPPSGVRLKDGSAPPSSRMTPVPPPPALPTVWDVEEDDDALEPTLLHEKAQARIPDIEVELPAVSLVPPVSTPTPTPTPSPALAALTPPSADVKITIAPLAPIAPRPKKPQGLDAATVAIFFVTFIGTIAAALHWVF